MSPNFLLIKEAMTWKKQCTAMYDWYYREFCPHVLGWSIDRSEMCLIYQFGWKTSTWAILSDTKDNWKCIKIDKLQDIQMRDWIWHTFGNHSKEQTCVKEVDTTIEF